MAVTTAEVGDTIEHTLMRGFRMKILDKRECEADGARPEEHETFKVIDPDGNEDWLCAYDVAKV